MAQVEITDEASLEAWLKGRPRGDAEIIAFRVAARVFPIWVEPFPPVAKEDKRVIILPLCRQLTIIRLARHNRVDAISAVSHEALYGDPISLSSAYLCAAITETSPEELHSELPPLIADLIFEAEFRVIDLLKVSKENQASLKADLFAALTADTNSLQLGQDPADLPLWPSTPPEWFTTADMVTRINWAKDPDTWAFWLRWWDGVIAGKSLQMDLQRDVALIADEVWQLGPKAVAREIARIEQIHDLRAQLAALTKAMDGEDSSHMEVGAALAHRGHNNPPEMIGAFSIVQATAVEIAQGLENAREELAKPAPEPNRLKIIGNGLLSAISSAAGYCAGLAGKTLQGFAETLGVEAAKWVVRLISGGVTLEMLRVFAKSMIAIWPL
jgi:hypothetical protein